MAIDGSNEQSNGLRTICSLNLLETGVAAFETDGLDAVEPGDIILGHGTGNWLSDLITKLDGYWSHSTLYVGDGRVAHAYTAGIGTMTLADLAGHYPDGIGVARPNKTAADRAAAATWALTMAEATAPGPRPAYSGRDLGTAFALLLRARRTTTDRLPTLDSTPDMVGADPLGFDEDTIDRFESTCSGFVYQAYSEGTDSPLEIVPAPGIELEDGLLRIPDEPGLWHELSTASPTAQPTARRPPDWRAWLAKARLVSGAMAGWINALGDIDDGIPLEQGVTPADLWCSPDVADQWFLTDHHRAVAVETAKHCV